ncbi:hypothetical protein L228DRAFT_251752 [Xylona heveae TC161]|uniref:Nucleoporin Pom152 n=1 Tax=Xylona heveae (strain CBS 132557 / TC161) TaxID=1328760 RepID=A0A164ZB03_XYLHT|nr:hypothetical protein L228DRAFT_251752 [Xylona heveae TC161]KZF18884.1 hypothetical protein L228DRAFT_251752 [Xylona heveae TC161]
MEGTPRLRSAYPTSPVSSWGRVKPNEPATASRDSDHSGSRGTTSKLPVMPQTLKSSEEAHPPLIPFEVIDAPSQRLYVLAAYGGITAWRLYDFWKLMTDEADPLWLFMKWVLVDGAFLYGLPGLRIPWLEWSFSTITVLFILHALLDGLLMFRVPIPLQTWLAAGVKVLYDRELSISENRVKPADILHNASLILGKQIIHILPEGSAVLNPQQQSFCLGSGRNSVSLPIRINQTTPILMELLRFDLDAQHNETIKLSAGQLKTMKRQAEKKRAKNDQHGSLYLDFPVKKTGLYRLQKVVDESKLEVQRRHSDTLVVTCPKAFVRPTGLDKCKGQLSDFSLEVEGTPPLKIKYSRTVNKADRGFSFQSIQPENLVSPLIRQRTGGLLVPVNNVDASWARPHRISVPLNESLSTSGEWLYSIEEVHDACGNIANYTQEREEWESSTKGTHLEQLFRVHEKPKAALDGRDQQHPLRVAKGESAHFPIHLVSPYSTTSESTFTFTYLFTPAEKLQPDGEHSPEASMHEVRIQNGQQLSEIETPGLYSLRSISSQYCSGEVFEPTTFLLLNPPEPDLSITSDNIYDKCAGNPIGLLVDLDLIGTPPFTVLYEIQRTGEKQTQVRFERIDRLRGQIELRPQEAGHYTYHFREISDAVYKGQSLRSKNLVLEQDVKPPASAHFVGGPTRKQACIDEPASFEIRLQGESPWTLDYEVVHGGKRSKQKIKGIETDNFVITTDKLTDGGDYSVTLTSVTDKSGCKIGLAQEAKIQVRHQRPKAAFGQIEGKRGSLMLEGKRMGLPIRLAGEAPWTIKYRNTDSATPEIWEKSLSYSNDIIDITDQGTYEILDVRDAICPGSVDANARFFEVSWIPRPQVNVTETPAIARHGDIYVQNDVCEGDDDAIELLLQGTPPYHVKYDQRLTPQHGPASLTSRDFTAGLGVASIRMETMQPGIYEYKFNELSDYLYDHDPKKYQPLIVRQKVLEKPSAKFTNPGKTYKFCKEAEFGDDIIPITFSGAAPFSAEIRIKHHSNPKPEIINIANINSNHYEFRIPHRLLALGNHVVTVHKVRDSRGCQRITEQDAPYVQVIVADVPSISPLDSQADFCVGERISYTLSGTPPFGIFYNFEGLDRKATSGSTTFRRIAEKPGNFTIYAVTDGMHECKAKTQITRMIHGMPSVKISKGQESVIDIHEGGEAEIIFDFWGTPPFEFTYTRSTNAVKGRKSQVLETKHDISYEHTKVIRASEEGTYEVIAIKDRFCAFSTQRAEGRTGQKLLQ